MRFVIGRVAEDTTNEVTVALTTTADRTIVVLKDDCDEILSILSLAQARALAALLLQADEKMTELTKKGT